MNNVENYIVNLPKWDDLPHISLYLDQVLELVNSNLSPYLMIETVSAKKSNKILTQTMVNNYVKQGFLPPPVKKRYNRLSVASLMVISTLKEVFEIREIDKLIHLAIDANSPKESYDYFCKLIKVNTELALKEQDYKSVVNESDPRGICSAAAIAFASKYYLNVIFLKGR
ncbi:DUF1836 domain-containing protein [Eubacteriales bacterium KG127]